MCIFFTTSFILTEELLERCLILGYSYIHMAYPESKEEELSESQKEDVKEEILSVDRDSEEIAEGFEGVSSSQVAGIKASLSRQGKLESDDDLVVLRDIISDYEEFYSSDRHRDEEYKWDHVRHFQAKWPDIKEKNGEEFVDSLMSAVEKGSNLIGWRSRERMRDVLEDKPERGRIAVIDLLDGEDDIYDRIDQFFEVFYRGHRESSDRRGTSFLLASLYPERFIHYKYTEFKQFFDEFGLELENGFNSDDRVQHYLDVNEKCKEILEQISVDDKDLWHVQDLIYYFNIYWMPDKLQEELNNVYDRGRKAYTRLFALKCFFKVQEDGSVSKDELGDAILEKAKEESVPGDHAGVYKQVGTNVFENYSPFIVSNDEYGVKDEYKEYLSAMSHYVDYLWSEVTLERSYYLISHNEHPEGLDEGFLKAPYTESSSDYDGRYQPSHDLSRLEVGDKLLHYRSGEFRGYSEVEEEPEVRTNEDGEKEFYLEVDIQKFDEPRRLGSVRQVLEEEKEKVDRYYALDEKGGKAEGYLKVLTERGFKHVVNMEDPQSAIEANEKLSAELDLGFDDLYFPEDEEESIRSQIKASLNSGKHIIFTGPPGTGKTELAEKVAKEMKSEEDNVTGFQLTTATSDWSTFDTVGGYRPEDDGSLEFKPGHILRRFKDEEKDLKNEALVIDEINRADIDKAFGQLFTVLSGQKVQLPFTKGDKEKEVEVVPGKEFEKPVDDHEFVVPESWRILATMNTYDKTSLYEMSYAFMRRFSFIRIEAPQIPEDSQERADLMDNFIQAWNMSVGPGPAEAVGEIWYRVNNAVDGREIGPAIAKDMLEFLNESGSSKASNTAAITNFIFPQLEGVPEREKIVESLTDVTNEGVELDVDRLERVASNMLQVDISGEE